MRVLPHRRCEHDLHLLTTRQGLDRRVRRGLVVHTWGGAFIMGGRRAVGLLYFCILSLHSMKTMIIIAKIIISARTKYRNKSQATTTRFMPSFARACPVPRHPPRREMGRDNRGRHRTVSPYDANPTPHRGKGGKGAATAAKTSTQPAKRARRHGGPGNGNRYY